MCCKYKAATIANINCGKKTWDLINLDWFASKREYDIEKPEILKDPDNITWMLDSHAYQKHIL